MIVISNEINLIHITQIHSLSGSSSGGLSGWLSGGLLGWSLGSWLLGSWLSGSLLCWCSLWSGFLGSFKFQN